MGFVGQDAEATELIISIDNSRHMYHRRADFEINQVKKIVSGKYCSTKAVRLWQYFVDEGAKQYNKQHGDGTLSLKLFKPAVRKSVASHYAKESYDETMRGNRAEAVLVALPRSQVALVNDLVTDGKATVKGRKGAVDGLVNRGMATVSGAYVKLSSRGKKLLGL